jgi:hypothetical protein
MLGCARLTKHQAKQTRLCVKHEKKLYVGNCSPVARVRTPRVVAASLIEYIKKHTSVLSSSFSSSQGGEEQELLLELPIL